MTFIDDTILKGAIDLHVHVGPDYSPRYSDASRRWNARNRHQKAPGFNCRGSV